MSFDTRTQTLSEDAAIDRDNAKSEFTGPHTHLDWAKDEHGNGIVVQVWDEWTKSYRPDFQRIERDCAGCWL